MLRTTAALLIPVNRVSGARMHMHTRYMVCCPHSTPLRTRPRARLHSSTPASATNRQQLPSSKRLVHTDERILASCIFATAEATHVPAHIPPPFCMSSRSQSREELRFRGAAARLQEGHEGGGSSTRSSSTTSTPPHQAFPCNSQRHLTLSVHNTLFSSRVRYRLHLDSQAREGTRNARLFPRPGPMTFAPGCRESKNQGGACQPFLHDDTAPVTICMGRISRRGAAYSSMQE